MTSTQPPVPVITLHDLSFAYGLARANVNAQLEEGEPPPPGIFTVLDKVSLTINRGEMVAITGPSGSGKTTLMNILGTLASPTGGTMTLAGRETSSLAEIDLATVRNRSIGFVFQQFHLLPRLTALENVLLPLGYLEPPPSPEERARIVTRAHALLDDLGILAEANKLPATMSGGQKQRVAIARALLMDPEILLADEPTGALDSRTAREVLGILSRLNREGRTIIIITHDPEVTKVARRRVELRDGVIVADVAQPGITVEDHSSEGNAPVHAPAETPRWRLVLDRVVRPWRESWQALASAKLRTALTSLGLVIGISSIIIMLTLGRAAQDVIINIFNQTGADRIYIGLDYRRVSGGGFAGYWEGLSVEKDIPALQNTFASKGRIVPLGRSFSQNVFAAGNQFQARIQPLYSVHDFFDEGLKIDHGRMISPWELENGARVALVGSDFTAQMFPLSYNGRYLNPNFPIGERVSLRGNVQTWLTIVGVLKKRDTTFESAEANTNVYMPLSTMNRYTGERNVTWLAVVPEKGISHSWLADSVRNYLTLKTGMKYPFRAHVPEEVISRIMLFIKVFQGLTVLIGGLCIIVGGIGIMNIMLVTIAERVREIGLRKALGGSPRSITRQFLLECVLLCVVSGLAGSIGGLAFCNIVSAGAHLALPDTVPAQVLLDPLAIGIGIFTSVACGLLFGMMPALKASRLDPSEALRSE